jgi:CubicO group peptidase (beta-lactamase class C family)
MCVDLARSQELPNDEKIRQLLADRIDVQQKSVGMVVGIITPQGRRLITYGRLNQGDTRPLDGNTVFEIGSVTKIFTALLLADMQHGEVQLDDPVAKYLLSQNVSLLTRIFILRQAAKWPVLQPRAGAHFGTPKPS